MGSENMERIFIDVYCKQCSKYLLSAPVGSFTYCNYCGAWTEAKRGGNDEKKLNRNTNS